MNATLAEVRRAMRRRRTADRRRRLIDAAYRDAVRAARQDGHTLQAIGDAAGVTREAIRQTLATELETRDA